ncbi:MAG: hypothetical protein JRF40_10030 [Deltaproteobacteria bacterium]|nr:hypothetical protein [Deltaproteobacteria bacterium]
MIRYEFVDSAIRDEDLHPDSFFDRERKLAKDFIDDLEKPDTIDPCPICGSPRNEVLFKKWGFPYAICPKSWTIGLASLPDEKKMHDYFRHSELSEFRASREYQNEVSKKRKELWESQLGWIEGRVSRYIGNEKYTVADWGCRFVGWIDFLKTAGFKDKLFVQEPFAPINESTNDIEETDIILLIDVLQRETKPLQLLKRIAKKVKPGGLLITTCRSGSGFDVLTLQGSSENIFPMDHIFLPSPQGMEFLLNEAGFELLELTTPGLLDMKYVQNAGKNIPKNQYFLRYIIEQRNELLLERMQGFLQRNNLSSHLRCVARKK